MCMRVPGHALGALCLGAAFTLVVFSEPARAQKARAGSDEKFLQAERLTGADSATFTSLKDGKTEVRADHQPVLEKAARWSVYRLTWPNVQEQSTKGPGET